jgi:probable HAF family extracellular repeat protein
MSRLLFFCTAALVFAQLIAAEPLVTPPNDLGTLGGVHSTATIVNDQGQVVGTSDFRFDRAFGTLQHAFSWTLEGGSRWC